MGPWVVSELRAACVLFTASFVSPTGCRGAAWHGAGTSSCLLTGAESRPGLPPLTPCSWHCFFGLPTASQGCPYNKKDFQRLWLIPHPFPRPFSSPSLLYYPQVFDFLIARFFFPDYFPQGLNSPEKKETI